MLHVFSDYIYKESEKTHSKLLKEVTPEEEIKIGWEIKENLFMSSVLIIYTENIFMYCIIKI